ncbi:MAG TPA: heparan-alpha-glucosaminide N-acetyltransferase domain-containing protein [Longimicrobiaceae bacterium]|nr:heparan-alpha-glucosaminide N-acetyltransferase domain-containing protein [Longimicrobiaceae bacterium]
MSITSTPEPSPIAPAVEVPRVPSTAGARLVSLDVFRGITIAGMLLVNNPGSWARIYSTLRHAEWNGWTPTDLIFPFFLFIVGVAMTFSFGKMRERGAARGELLAKSAKRALILFVLGLILHSFPWWGVDLGTLRIPGVLQRIALAYLLASVIILWTDARGQATAAAAIVLGYWAVMAWVPVPGIGAGVWEPGQDIGAYIDRLVFGTEHLWSQSRTWDPEGLLSTIPAVASVLLGALTGHWLRSDRTATLKTAGLLAAGVAALILGLAWGAVFPINKSLWTSSYVVFTGGMALLFLAGCYWLVDVKGYRRWSQPFVIFGMNAIAAFFLSGIFARVLGMIQVPAPEGTVSLKARIYAGLLGTGLPPIDASLAFAVLFVLFWLAVMAIFYRKGIFIKV